jgi:DNA modification methylase
MENKNSMSIKTEHNIIYENAAKMEHIADKSVDLIVTSPPYPMIQMWDEIFSSQNKKIAHALSDGEGMLSFDLMHKELDKVWNEIYRVLKNGGFACINIGDATRTIGGNFCLYPNHSRILQYLHQTGFHILPDIIWRKQTNAPNKFMGSGMLPAGAYVTLEHEYILIARKNGKRSFTSAEEKRNRHDSALFWEERNTWFSDVWMDIKGTTQKLHDKKTRSRSAAFPFELAHRLINMYSVKHDIVLDPFMGTGTTMAAAMASCRNSIGFEFDLNLCNTIESIKKNIVCFSNSCIEDRLQRHLAFAEEREKAKGPLKHTNDNYGFPVVTSQERKLLLNRLTGIKSTGIGRFEVSYASEASHEFKGEKVFGHENKKDGAKIYNKSKEKQQYFDFDKLVKSKTDFS